MILDVDAILTQGRLIQQVDDARTATDPFKLPSFLRTTLNSDVTAVASFDSVKDMAESVRRGSIASLNEAVARLADLLRDGFAHVNALPSFELSREAKRDVLIAYGFDGGKLGSLQTKARVIELGRKVVEKTPQITPVAARFPSTILTRIQAELVTITAALPNTTSGNRQSATRQRNAAARGLSTTLLRARFYYASASLDADKTPELARIGFQPRRNSGQRRLPGETTATP